jgi:hypothetical protein
VVQEVKIVGERNWKYATKNRKKVGKNVFIRPRLTKIAAPQGLIQHPLIICDEGNFTSQSLILSINA